MPVCDADTKGLSKLLPAEGSLQAKALLCCICVRDAVLTPDKVISLKHGKRRWMVSCRCCAKPAVLPLDTASQRWTKTTSCSPKS